jgi:hypothetical protein
VGYGRATSSKKREGPPVLSLVELINCRVGRRVPAFDSVPQEQPAPDDRGRSDRGVDAAQREGSRLSRTRGCCERGGGLGRGGDANGGHRLDCPLRVRDPEVDIEPLGQPHVAMAHDRGDRGERD